MVTNMKHKDRDSIYVSTVHAGIKTARNTREVTELHVNTYNNENQCE